MSRLDPDVLASLHGQNGKDTLSLSLSLSLCLSPSPSFSLSFSLSHSPFILNTHRLTDPQNWVGGFLYHNRRAQTLPLKTNTPLRPSPPYPVSPSLSISPSLPLSLSLFLSISQEKLTSYNGPP